MNDSTGSFCYIIYQIPFGVANNHLSLATLLSMRSSRLAVRTTLRVTSSVFRTHTCRTSKLPLWIYPIDSSGLHLIFGGMSLELSQLDNLRNNPKGSVNVCYLPPAVSLYLNCPLSIAYISSLSLNHILEKHPDIKLIDMLCLPWMIQYGIWLPDKEKSACVLYLNPDTGKRFKSAIKSAGDGYETYITTFHQCKTSQWNSLLGRYTPICGAW